MGVVLAALDVFMPETTGGSTSERGRPAGKREGQGEGEAPKRWVEGGGGPWQTATAISAGRPISGARRASAKRVGPVLRHSRGLVRNRALRREPHAPHMRTPLRSSLKVPTSVPSVTRPPGPPASAACCATPTQRAGPSALRPRVTASLPVRGCSPFGSSASSTPGPLSRLPVDETRGFAPQPRGWFALSWFERFFGTSTLELEQEFRIRQNS